MHLESRDQASVLSGEQEAGNQRQRKEKMGPSLLSPGLAYTQTSLFTGRPGKARECVMGIALVSVMDGTG